MNPMFDAMNKVAAQSWNLMTAGIEHGIGPGEETLTDVSLILLRGLIPSLRVKKFSKAVEAGNGADWEWWIGSSSEERWIKLRVQAKRASHEGVRYEQLGHSSPKSNGAKQYDTLIAQSLIDGAIPFHVFFNGWPEDRFFVDGRYHDAVACHRRAARDGFLPGSAWDALNWGCSIASTETVKKIFEDPTISDFPASVLGSKQMKDCLYIPRYLVHSTPWAHLLSSHRAGAGVAPTVREVAENVHRMQGKDWALTDAEFREMTYPRPSREAEQAAYDGRYTIYKSTTVLDEQYERRAKDRDRAEEFIRLMGQDSDLWRLLENTDEDNPGYRILLELDPGSSPFLNPSYGG